MGDDLPKCGALPAGGDGSASCDLVAGHRGLHACTLGEEQHTFRRIVPGTSSRALWLRARRGR